jgi:hypothetical protein
MNMLFAGSPLRAAGLALACSLAASTLAAAPVPSEGKPKETTPADKIRQALDKPVTKDIEAQPLHLALNQLKEDFGVTFVLDRFTIQQLGLDPEQLQVNFKPNGAKLRTALRSILGQHNLSFAIVGDSVLVTTDEMAMYRQMRQRVNVDFSDAEFARAIKQLASETATNLIIDSRSAKQAKGAVTLQLEDVPLETAVRLMSEMVGLKPVRVGNVMFICSKEAAADLKTDADLVPPGPGVPGYGPAGPGGLPGAPGGLVLPVPVTPPVIEKPKQDAPDEKKKEEPKEEKRQPNPTTPEKP